MISPMPDLPAGTVTFLFTDVEGSTRLLHELGAGGDAVLPAAARGVGGGEQTEGGHGLKVSAEPVAISQLGWERFPPLKTISNTNLPRPVSSFVGREREVGEVVSLIRKGARLL